MSDIYLSIAETPTVVTLTNPLISSNVAQSVTVTNVVSVNVVTMPAITVQAAAPAVTTVAGTVSISNFPSTQTIAGTVTASLSESLLYPDGATGLTKGIAVGFLENQIAQPAQFTIPNTDGSRPFPVAIVLNDDAEYANGVGNGVNSKFLPISGTVTANLSSGDQNNPFSTYILEGDNDVRIGNTNPLPISGTVTANGGNFLNADNALITKDSATNVILLGGLAYSTTPTLSQIQALQTSGTGVLKVYQEETNWTDTNQGNQPRRASQQTPFPVQILGGSVTIGNTVTARLQDGSGNNLTSTSIGGLQRLNVSLASAATPGGTLPSFVNVYGGSDGSAVRTISVDSSGRQNTNPQFPRVTLIDGSGTVATANTAITVFASSSTRSYLLVQVTTGSAFVNVGATATTVNGINLTAGQGYSWETTIPQGIVSLISTTTSSRYVAKEA